MSSVEFKNCLFVLIKMIVGHLFEHEYNTMPKHCLVVESAEIIFKKHNDIKCCLEYMCGIYHPKKEGIVGMIHSDSSVPGAVRFCETPKMTKISGSGLCYYEPIKRVDFDFDFDIYSLPHVGIYKDSYSYIKKLEVDFFNDFKNMKRISKLCYISGIAGDNLIYSSSVNNLGELINPSLIYIKDIINCRIIE
jgi:hypothetical protein